MAEQKFLKEWQDVDRAEDAGTYGTYLDTINTHSVIRTYKQQSYTLLQPEEGDHILDVGCGNGDDVRALARIVGSTGRVVGIDGSQELIQKAQQHPDNGDLPVEFHVCDANNLFFDENHFHSCRADRVFQHLPHRERVLAEMIRVTRPGGRIMTLDPDWQTLIVDMPGERSVTRTILNYFVNHAARNGWAGREGYGLFKRAQLADVSVTPTTGIYTEYNLANVALCIESTVHAVVAAGEIDAESAAAWLSHLQAADEAGGFFMAFTGFAVCGRKPGERSVLENKEVFEPRIMEAKT